MSNTDEKLRNIEEVTHYILEKVDTELRLIKTYCRSLIEEVKNQRKCHCGGITADCAGQQQPVLSFNADWGQSTPLNFAQ